MLRIDLTPLSEGVHHIALAPEAEALDLDPDQFADIHVDATLDLFNERVLVLLQASAVATLECDRTLTLFEQSIEGTYRLFYAPPSFVGEEGEEDTGYEEVRVLYPADRSIDLTDAVRDTLLLAVPARKIAPGAEDLEIQTTFGVPADEADIDPRWEALRSLRSGNDGG